MLNFVKNFALIVAFLIFQYEHRRQTIQIFNNLSVFFFICTSDSRYYFVVLLIHNFTHKL